MSDTPTFVFTRWGQVIFLVIGFDAVLMATSIAMDTHMLSQPNSWQYIGEPLMLLAVYVALTFSICRRPSPSRSRAIGIGASFGIVTGLLWVIDLNLETFVDNAGIPLTAPFLLGGFILWGVAGYVATERTRAFSLGILAAIVSAMTCVVMTITFGFLMPFFATARLQYLLKDDPDFVRSGWTSVRDFVLANQFDSAFSHLLGALLVGICVGAIGSGIAQVTHRGELKTAA